MVDNRFDEANGILYVTVEGKGKVEDMLKAIDFLKLNTELPRKLKILEDATKAEFTIQGADMVLIVEKLKKVVENYDSICHAVIHKGPNGTALAILANQMVNNPKYKMEVFSTRPAAEFWLKS